MAIEPSPIGFMIQPLCLPPMIMELEIKINLNRSIKMKILPTGGTSSPSHTVVENKLELESYSLMALVNQIRNWNAQLLMHLLCL